MATAFPQRTFALLGLAGMALALYALRPQSQGEDKSTPTCLSNLSQISRAYAQYALDYDGKIPRGVDPSDRYDELTWRDNDRYGSRFYADSKHAPWLQDLLRPYVPSRQVFHCPADHGWDVSRLSQTDTRLGLGGFRLQNVHPSLFKRYGTSYLSWTKYGFTLCSAADISNPSHKVLLFDADLWHSAPGQDLLNGLFVDGHVENLTVQQFAEFSRD